MLMIHQRLLVEWNCQIDTSNYFFSFLPLRFFRQYFFAILVFCGISFWIRAFLKFLFRNVFWKAGKGRHIKLLIFIPQTQLEQVKTLDWVSGFHWSALEFSQTFASVFTRLWRHGKHVLFFKYERLLVWKKSKTFDFFSLTILSVRPQIIINFFLFSRKIWALIVHIKFVLNN